MWRGPKCCWKVSFPAKIWLPWRRAGRELRLLLAASCRRRDCESGAARRSRTFNAFDVRSIVSALSRTRRRAETRPVLHIGPLGRLHCSGSRSCWRAPTPPQVIVILDKSAGASGGSAAQPSRTPSAAAIFPSRRETAAAVPSTPRRARARSRGGRARATRAGAGSVRASPLAPRSAVA